MSHFGRPKGPDPAQSLRPLVEPLSRAIGGRTVHFAPDCIGPEAERVVDGAEAGRGRAAGKPALPPGGGEERPGLREAAGGARRRLCRRRVLGGAPGARLDRGAGASAAGGGRQEHAGRVGGARRGAGKSETAGHGAGRRRQGVDQARPVEIHDRQGRQIGDRRRDGQHLSVRAGPAGRPLTVRARHGRHGARDPGRGRGARLRDHPARRCGDRREARTRGGDPHGRGQRGAGDGDDPRYRAATASPASAPRSKPRRRWCGTVRSARSKRRPSTAARSRSPRRSPS